MDYITITTDDLVKRIAENLNAHPFKPTYSHFKAAPDPPLPALYSLIVGAGFSFGVVPLVDELMHQTIGDYYYPDQDGTSMERPTEGLENNSAYFWAEYNEVIEKGKPKVELNDKGLPLNPGDAYEHLFEYATANRLFEKPIPQKPSYLGKLIQARGQESPNLPENIGERFVKGFLRYVLDPGGEHGYGSTGRNQLNSAHIYLAALLEAQQLGNKWPTRPFSRTILTTNFDTLLQNALQLVNLIYNITDRPEKGLDHSDFTEKEGTLHLVYTHGSILRHNPASAKHEIDALAASNLDVLRDHLQSHDVITIGYSGWEDGLMAALKDCDSNHHKVYCCDVKPTPSSAIADLLRGRAGNSFYVCLGDEGADGLMNKLYQTLVLEEAKRGPMQRYKDWNAFVQA